MPKNLLRYDHASSADLVLDPVADDVLILPVSAPENHGPHLPLGTDTILSEELARRVGENLARLYPQRRIWLHPAWALGGATIRGVGSLKIRSHILRRVFKSYFCRCLKQGFRHFVLLSVHGGVPHVGAMDDACAWLRRQGDAERPVHAVAPAARLAGRAYFGHYAQEVRQAGVELSDRDIADLAWDLHAGRMETSMMLAAAPDLVRPCYRTIPPIRPPRRRWLEMLQHGLGRVLDHFLKNEEARRDMHHALQAGAIDFSWILRGRREGYVGQPHLASTAEGEALLNAVSLEIAENVQEIFTGRLDPKVVRSGAFLLRRTLLAAGMLLAGIVTLLWLLIR